MHPLVITNDHLSHPIRVDVPLLVVAILIGLTTSPKPASATITVDPDGVGSLDVVQDPFGSSTLLINPLSDPLDLGALELAVGNTSNGDLAIEAGGSVSNRTGRIGRVFDSAGFVMVTGTGSTWTNSDFLFVGDKGDGTLNIEAGGSVSTSTGILGADSGSTGMATVTDTGSTWTNSDNLSVGRRGDGTLNIEAGGSVSSRIGTIGADSGSTGTVTVTGTGSLWTIDDDFFVGREGVGVLSIANGGSVAAGRTIFVNAPQSRIVLDGGTLTAPLLQLSGTLSGKGDIHGDLDNMGFVAPGFSPGSIDIDGDYTQQVDGALEIEVGGLTPGTQHDQLRVTGTATLGGRLEAPLIDSFVPIANDEVTFLTADVAVTGQFDAITAANLATLAPGLALRVIRGANDVKLRFVDSSAEIKFDSGTPTADWSDDNTWTTDDLPSTVSIINIENTLAASQRVDVTNESAFTHQLTVQGSINTVTVGVENGRSLSATTSVTIGNNGVIELDDGNLVSSTIQVQGGGLIAGNGTVVGDVTVGATSGTGSAVVSPGFSVGSLSINGDYRQTSGGELVIEVDSVTEFDTVDITGRLSPGGTVNLVLADDANVVEGDVIEFMSSGSLTEGEVFQDVVTTGSDGLFFAPIYQASDPMAIAASVGVSMQVHDIGDMDLGGGGPSVEDIPVFALALRRPNGYFRRYKIKAHEAGDLDQDGDLDFDDIDDFAAAISGMSVAEVYAAILHASQVPEPSSASLALFLFLVAALQRRGPLRSAADRFVL